jgi:alkanesulfonate monooxygenase SsuD/methylene tetrahydromethanopterin reductase-like flavin-dependent oxidoreductase (luciferase family)
MKPGFFTMPMHPPGRDYTQTLKEDREAVLLADRLGYSEAYFGIGPGGLRSDMEVCGNLDADRNAMFVEAIDQILALWAGDAPYNLKGRFWNISTERTLIRAAGQGVMVKPYQQPHPPIVVTVVVPHSKGLAAAAERGWQPIMANFLQPAWAATKRKSAGGVEIFKHDRALPDSAVTMEYILDRLVICGGVDSVVDQLLAFRETVGDFGTLLYCGHDWADPGLARRSMELMAEKVMPAVNTAISRASRAV